MNRGLPDDTVGTLADNVEDLVLFTDVEVACAWVGGCSHFRDGVAEALCDSRENGGVGGEGRGMVVVVVVVVGRSVRSNNG